MPGHDFDVASAQRAVAEGRLQHWFEAFLPTVNMPLLEGLQRAPRWWAGPLCVPLQSLERSCGPEDDMEYLMTSADWERRLGVMDTSFVDRDDFPPLIATLRQGKLSLRDGNTRHELFRRRAIDQCWVLVWYNQAEDAIIHGHIPQALHLTWPVAE